MLFRSSIKRGSTDSTRRTGHRGSSDSTNSPTRGSINRGSIRRGSNNFEEHRRGSASVVREEKATQAFIDTIDAETNTIDVKGGCCVIS